MDLPIAEDEKNRTTGVADYDAYNDAIFLSLLCVLVHLSSRVLRQCWPRAPTEFMGLGVLYVVLWVVTILVATP